MFPQYSKARAAAIGPDIIPVEWQKMNIKFYVPVDHTVLQACRKKRGYKSAYQLHKILKDHGFSLNYSVIECCDGATIRGDNAALIAGALGMEPDEVFPQYSKAKTIAEQCLAERYYRPFTNLIQRDNAIVAAMGNVKQTALKYGRRLKTEGVPIDREEIISIAYETLVSIADRAMNIGIPKGANFNAYACVSVKYALFGINKKANRGNLDFYSLEVCSEFRDLPENFRVDGCFNSVILRDEALAAYEALPEAKKRDKRIAGLYEEMQLESASCVLPL